MITFILLQTLITVLGAILFFLPVADTLPLVDSYLSTGMGYVRFVMEVFPPLGIMYTGFLVILGFKTTLMVLRLFHIIR